MGVGNGDAAEASAESPVKAAKGGGNQGATISPDGDKQRDRQQLQIWPSFQLNVKSPPVGGLLIAGGCSDGAGHTCRRTIFSNSVGLGLQS